MRPSVEAGRSEIWLAASEAALYTRLSVPVASGKRVLQKRSEGVLSGAAEAQAASKLKHF